jgi:large subunit ribosomal protein L24e
MPKCSFCQNQYSAHLGMTYVEVSGRIRPFCSSKCRKNFFLGRDAKKVLWVTKQKKAEKKA